MCARLVLLANGAGACGIHDTAPLLEPTWANLSDDVLLN